MYKEEFTISRKIWMVANHPLDKCVLNWCGILREADEGGGELETSSWPGWLTWLIVFSLYKSIYIYILMYRAYLPPPLPRVSKKIIFYFCEILFENLFVFFYIMWCKHKILLFRKNCFCNFVTFSRNCFCRSSTPPPLGPHTHSTQLDILLFIKRILIAWNEISMLCSST